MNRTPLRADDHLHVPVYTREYVENLLKQQGQRIITYIAKYMPEIHAMLAFHQVIDPIAPRKSQAEYDKAKKDLSDASQRKKEIMRERAGVMP